MERHVTPSPAGGWQVVNPARDQISVITATRDDATQRARRVLRTCGGGTLVLYGPDGTAVATEAVEGELAQVT